LQLGFNALISGAIYSLVAMGVAVLYGTTRFFNLALGAVYTVAAYVAYSAWTHVGPIPATLAAIAFCAVLNWTIDRFVFYSLRRRKSPPMILMLASFGILIALQGAVALIYSSNTLTLHGASWVDSSVRVLGAAITRQQLMIVGVTVLSLAATVAIMRTRWGRTAQAVASDALGASVVGVDSESTIGLASLLGGALVGLAGVLIAMETNIEPAMGFDMILKGMIASVAGGMGSIAGAVLGGLTVGSTEQLAAWYLGADWSGAAAFVVLLLFLVFRPNGLLGRKEERY